MPMEGWVKGLSPQNTLSFRGKQCCSWIQYNWSNRWLLLQIYKKQAGKTTEHASTLLLWCHPSVRKPRHSDLTWNGFIYTVFLAWMSSVILSSELHTPPCSRPRSPYGGFFVLFLRLKKSSPFTSIVSDLAATPFTMETLKGFCGLKHFNRRSIGIVVSR